MPQKAQVVEAGYNYSGRLVLALLATGKPPYKEEQLSGRVYRDVPLEVWEKFDSVKTDAQSRKFFTENIEGKYSEEIIDFSLYQVAKVIGPAVLDHDD